MYVLLHVWLYMGVQKDYLGRCILLGHSCSDDPHMHVTAVQFLLSATDMKIFEQVHPLSAHH